jgi:hypothetical protein
VTASVVQLKAATAAVSVTFDASTQTGNSIVVCIWRYTGNIDTGRVVDNKGNTYAFRGTDGTNTRIGFYDCQAPTMGAGHQVSINAGNASNDGLIAWEVANLTGSPSFDKYAGDGASSATPTTGATATLAQADEIVFAAISTDQGNSDTITPTAGEGWTPDAEDENGATVPAFNAVHKTVSATTAVSASWALGASHEWGCSIATYRAAAAALGFTVAQATLDTAGNPVALARPPDAPTNLVATSDVDSSVPLTWDAPADNGGSALTDYTVQYRVAP